MFVVSTDHSLLKLIMIFHMDEKSTASSFRLHCASDSTPRHAGPESAVNADHQPSAQAIYIIKITELYSNKWSPVGLVV